MIVSQDKRKSEGGAHLENAFKFESVAIPESELSSVTASQTPPSIRRPSYAINTTPNLHIRHFSSRHSWMHNSEMHNRLLVPS